jgi:hypothetical protein
MVRFLSNMFVVIAGALLLTASSAVRLSVLSWLALAAGCAVAVVLLVAFPVRGRGNIQRRFDVATMAIAVWTIVAARSLSSGELNWWILGDASAFFALGIGGLLSGQLELRAALSRLMTTPASPDGLALAPTNGRALAPPAGSQGLHAVGDREAG